MKNNLCLYSRRRLHLTLLFMMFGLLTIYSQCPIITTPTQTFCDIQSPIVGNLVATNLGNGVRWYATSVSTTPLSSAAGLINGEDYYADDNSGTCGTRERVDVIIYGPPIGLNFQGVCVDDPNEATIADLVATGNDVRWYNVPTGGAPLLTSTVLIDNTIYYADQSNPITGCRTSRLSVFVNVGVVPVPTGVAIQEFCANQMPAPTVADLIASGTNNWYSTLSSAVPLDPATPLVDGVNYYATTVDPPCESFERFEVLVVFNMPNNPGENGTIDVCETDVIAIQTVDLFDGLNGTPMNGGTWTGPFPTSNGSIGTVDITAMTAVGSPYIFTYIVDASIGCDQSTANVTVTIIPPPNAGTNGAVTFCGNASPVDLFDSLGGTPDAGGTWSPALASGSGLFDPLVDTAGTYTYTVTGTPPCTDASATVTVTIIPPPNAGTNGSVTFCENGLPLDLFDSLGGTPDAGGTWSPALASGTGLFDPLVDTAGTYTYTVTGTPPCTDASATVTVTIIPPPNAGTNGAVTFCGNASPVDLFDSLGGTPDAGGTWSPALASGTGLFDPLVDTAGTYTYTVTGTPPCTDASATVTVTIIPPPNAGTNGSVTFCENGLPLDLFDSLGGTPDAGGTWSPALASGTGLFDPLVDTAGTYTYTVTGTGSPTCSASAIVIVTIIFEPNAGIDGSITFCSNDTPLDLFNSLGGTPDTGGTWSPALASGTGQFDPSIDTAGIYTYTVEAIFPCRGTSSAIITVSINQEPNAAGAAVSVENVCHGLATNVTISNATLLIDGTYTLIYDLSGANISQNNSATIDFIAGNTNFTIPIALLTNPGSTTITITQLTLVVTQCGADVSNIIAVPFTIFDAPTPTLVADGNIFCLEDNPTIQTLTANILELEPIIWYDAAIDGIAHQPNDLLIDGNTYYASLLTSDRCESLIRLAVTVTLNMCEEPVLVIPDGFSPNGDGTNDTFDIVNIRELFPNFTLEIFNRYGNVLYKGNKDTPNWDGTSQEGSSFGNSTLPVGVYFFILEFNDNATEPIQDRVYLSR